MLRSTAKRQTNKWISALPSPEQPARHAVMKTSPLSSLLGKQVDMLWCRLKHHAPADQQGRAWIKENEMLQWTSD